MQKSNPNCGPLDLCEQKYFDRAIRKERDDGLDKINYAALEELLKELLAVIHGIDQFEIPVVEAGIEQIKCELR